MIGDCIISYPTDNVDSDGSYTSSEFSSGLDTVQLFTVDACTSGGWKYLHSFAVDAYFMPTSATTLVVTAWLFEVTDITADILTSSFDYKIAEKVSVTEALANSVAFDGTL